MIDATVRSVIKSIEYELAAMSTEELLKTHQKLIDQLLQQFDGIEGTSIPIAAVNTFARNGCISLYELGVEMERVLDIAVKARVARLPDILMSLVKEEDGDEDTTAMKLLSA